nr:ATP-binding protein [uncultured Cupriavidus sp.]
MAGAKGRLTGSIQARLSLWLSLAILAVAVVGGVVSFATAFDEAIELQDDLLRQVAILFDVEHLPAPRMAELGKLPGIDEEARVIVEYAGPEAGGQMAARPGKSLGVPAGVTDGIHSLTLNAEPFRVLVRTLPNGGRVLVAQETGMRDEIAHDSALRTVLPFLILVPLLLLIVADLIRKLFRPMGELAAEINQRQEQDLEPLRNEHLPAEVRPFVLAINRLLARVSQSMEVQRQFIANAAHELRSPMTALSLQAERLAQADMSQEARTRLAPLRQGIERGRHLLEQLLSLARVQSSPSQSTAAISVLQVFRRVIEDLMPLADARHTDVGVLSHVDVQIEVDEVELFTLVRNLVDNAIRYSPEGGAIDLSVYVEDDQIVLTCVDSGPGISPDERAKVLTPFYRTPGTGSRGSGLGLSIVNTIAGRHDAEIRIDHADPGGSTGTRISIRFPRTLAES